MKAIYRAFVNTVHSYSERIANNCRSLRIPVPAIIGIVIGIGSYPFMLSTSPFLINVLLVAFFTIILGMFCFARARRRRAAIVNAKLEDQPQTSEASVQHDHIPDGRQQRPPSTNSVPTTKVGSRYDPNDIVMEPPPEYSMGV